MIESRRRKGNVAVTCERDADGGWVFTAWEAEGSKWTRIDQRRRDDGPLPDDTIARYELLEAWERAQRQRAYDTIFELYPEAKGGMRTKGRGSIRVLLDPGHAQPQGKHKKGEDRDAEAAPAFAGSGGIDDLPLYETTKDDKP